MRRLRLLLPALLMLVASACGSGAADETAAADQLIATASGGQIDLNALEGTDTVLWFWAPW